MHYDQYLYIYGYPDQIPVPNVLTFYLILLIVFSGALLTVFTLILDQFLKDDLKNYQHEINADLKKIKYYHTTDGAWPDQ